MVIPPGSGNFHANYPLQGGDPFPTKDDIENDMGGISASYAIMLEAGVGQNKPVADAAAAKVVAGIGQLQTDLKNMPASAFTSPAAQAEALNMAKGLEGQMGNPIGFGQMLGQILGDLK